jgi:hypothetical protein
MHPLIAKLILAVTLFAFVSTVGAAVAAPVMRHSAKSAHPVKKPHPAIDAPKPEKLVMAPGGVMVPRQAPAGHNPGFMDDGASKRGQKP